MKSYGDVVALRGVDLDVASGQVVSLLGKNGAGKSTLLSIVAGLVRPDAGSVEIDGLDALRRPDAASRLIGIAPQETGIYPILTVQENLDFFGELAGLNRADRRRRVSEVAEQIGLGTLLERRAGSLSGGEARRLHTGCALLHKPKLLMLDEPTVGADVATRAQLIEAVKQLAAEGAAVIYTTHYLPEVEALEADVVIIDNGSILATGTQSQLVEAHSLQGLRIQIEGELPDSLRGLHPVAVDPGFFRIERPISMTELLAVLGPDTDALLSVELLRPDLETVFLAVTGRRLDADDPDPMLVDPGAGDASRSAK